MTSTGLKRTRICDERVMHTGQEEAAMLVELEFVVAQGLLIMVRCWKWKTPIEAPTLSLVCSDPFHPCSNFLGLTRPRSGVICSAKVNLLKKASPDRPLLVSSPFG